MNLSPKDIRHIEAELKASIVAVHAAHLARGEGTLEAFLDWFSEDVIAVGTGADEVVRSKAELIPLLEREWAQTPDALGYHIHAIDVRVVSNACASTQSFFDIFLGGEGGASLAARMSTVFKKVDGAWKIVHWHASAPSEIQPEGVSWPTEQLKARALKLEQEVAARTAELSQANRHLAFDAAIERVRRVTREMQTPSDLTEVVKQMKREFDALFPHQVLEVDLVTEVDEDTYRFWSIIDVAEVPESMAQFGQDYPKNGNPPHPVLDRLWAFDGDYWATFADKDEMWQVHASLAAHIPHQAELLKTVLESGHLERMWFSASSVASRRLFFAWAVEPPEEMSSFQPRMANELGLAFKRVEELELANRRALGARVEAAVERVRGRALAMRTSEEIVDVATEIMRQMSQLQLAQMTAYDNEEYRGKAADLDCDGYVSKPIDFQALKDKIESFRQA